MYCLWKTQGVTIRPWRKDVVFGAVRDGDVLKVALISEKPWKGKVLFDSPRHKTNMKLPIDWPRINQFPEWFVASEDKKYEVDNLTAKKRATYTGNVLREGISIELKPKIENHLWVTRVQ
jgi:hypothetical protein